MAIAATDATIQDERMKTSSAPPARTTIANTAKPTRIIDATGSNSAVSSLSPTPLNTIAGVNGAYIPGVLTAAGVTGAFGAIYAAHGLYAFIDWRSRRVHLIPRTNEGRVDVEIRAADWGDEHFPTYETYCEVANGSLRPLLAAYNREQPAQAVAEGERSIALNPSLVVPYFSLCPSYLEADQGAGFEPGIRFPVYTLSRRAPWTAPAPLRSRLPH